MRSPTSGPKALEEFASDALGAYADVRRAVEILGAEAVRLAGEAVAAREGALGEMESLRRAMALAKGRERAAVQSAWRSARRRYLLNGGDPGGLERRIA